MAILTKPTITKGQANEFDLSKSELAAISKVVNDSYFSDQANWSKVAMEYESTEGKQFEMVIFDASDESPKANFELSEKAKDDWEIKSIIIMDFDGGYLKLVRGDLTVEEFDIALGSVIILDGVIDTAFMNNLSNWGYSSSNKIQAVDLDSNGSVYVGGSFSNYGEPGVNNFAKLNSDGTRDMAFINNAVIGPKFGGVVYSCKVLSDDSLMVSGQFTYDPGSTPTRTYVVKLDSNGLPDETFCSNAIDGSKFSFWAYCFAEDSSNNIFIGGGFANYPSTVGNVSQNYFLKFSSTGILDDSFMSNAVANGKFRGNVNAVGALSDGSVVVAGSFTNYDGTSGRNRLVKLNSDGTLDTAFCANASDGSKFNNVIRDMYVYPNGKVLVVGNFTNYNGVTGLNSIARLNADGSPDTAFNNNIVAIGISAPSGLSLVIYDVTVNASGTIFIGGSFAGLGTNFKLGSINEDGTPNSDFNAALGTTSGGGSVLDLASDSNSVYVGTSDTAILGRSKLIKII